MRHQRHGLGLLDGSNPSARITSSIDINSKFISPRFRLHHQSNYPGSSAYLLQTIVASLEEGPQITAYIKWDVKNGRARTDSPQVGTYKQLEGSPYVQGIEIRSGIHVKVSCFQSMSCDGEPSNVIEEPTNGMRKFDARRITAYKIEAY
ncbi:Uncharacterized protein HZ326_4052 [Fusarium oxysporum f. sp. albedinis]|nr:Uncharacterized protein HZ326_4052 [Fusarium oxysporum f. sp. albedinis]